MDLDTTTQEILLAASNHDLDALKPLLRSGSASVQDPDTGSTPLHAAVGACEDDEETAEQKRQEGLNGDETAALASAALEEDEAVKTVKFLLLNGAIWNDLDNNNETPGCQALRLGLKKVYAVLVEAGVRAELLLNRLDDFELLADADEEDDESDEAVDGFEVVHSNGDGANGELQESMVEVQESVPELIRVDENGLETTVDVNTVDYLASDLTFGGDRILDADKNGVMMEWERDIMQQSADSLVSEDGLRILNIGHGMGIIDDIFQAKVPAVHHIIEAHPAVLERMRTEGWNEKRGVAVHEGRWQDVVLKLAEQGEIYDVIYFDTFAEDYKALKEFFSEHVIALLDPNGHFGFFNGLGADRQICYDVYTQVVEMDLFDAGLDTAFKDIDIPNLDEKGEWEGVRRRYWALDTYRMPTCKFIG